MAGRKVGGVRNGPSLSQVQLETAQEDEDDWDEGSRNHRSPKLLGGDHRVAAGIC